MSSMTKRQGKSERKDFQGKHGGKAQRKWEASWQVPNYFRKKK